MTLGFKLRDYQDQAIRDLFKTLKNKASRPLLVAPTGAGKSVIIAGIVQRVREIKEDARFLIVAPRKELVTQNAQKLNQLGLRPAICAASLGSKRINENIVIGTPGTIVNALERQLHKPHLLIVDEAHRFPPEGEGVYQKIWQELGERVRLIGLTATPYRMGTGSLIGATFTEIAANIPISTLIAQGHLVPPTTRPVQHFDLSRVRISNGDYSGESMRQEIEAQDFKIVTAAIDQLAPTRRACIVFAASVSHAEHVAATLNVCYQSTCAYAVTSKTQQSERKRIIKAFQAGQIRFLVSRDIFTEGFDAPCVDLIVMLRKTLSTGLYVQMVGRGMRPFPGKEDCLVLDFVGNIDQHGYVDDIRVDPYSKKQKREKTEARLFTPIELCQECGGYFSLVRGKCHRCFPDTVRNDYAEPSKSAILSSEDATQHLDVDQVLLSLHHGKRRQTVLVHYVSRNEYGMPSKRVSEHLIFDPASPMYHRAVRWFQCFATDTEAPNNAQDAYNELKKISEERQNFGIKFVRYKIRRKGQYTNEEIVAYG